MSRQASFGLLALMGMVALAQTPPASAAPKAGDPMFAELRSDTQTVSASNASPAIVGERRVGDRGQGAEGGGQSVMGVAGANAATASTSTNVTPGAPASLSGYMPDDKYKLRVGDRISLQILEDRDAPKSLVVADSGELDVPYVGRVAASDKTSKQLADELKTRLEKEYYHRATVVIALDVANKLLGRIYVWGQVRNQGPIDISVNENLTAGKAILRAGGFGDFANKKKVKIVRSGATDGAAKQSFELNMVNILEKGKTEKDVVLQPDDFIIVPSRLINF
jgi:protein involved in polysaccharide export with SLBB domain